jgi:NADH:ubiquinone oxidoreductase subunit H
LFFFFFFSVLFVLVFLVLSVAFITLFERHILRLRHGRLGPNKVFFFGVAQAVLDGLKLLSKEQLLPFKASVFLFLFLPGGFFILFFFEFFCAPFFFFFFNFQFSFLFLLCLVGLSVYFLIVGSVLSKSKYSYVGGLRASSQRVSFEIVFSFYLLCFIFFFIKLELSFDFFVVNFFLFFCFLLIVVAELNRAPFDFSEGERELVRGFNTEFSRVSFVLLFLGEYGFIIFFRVLGGLFFFWGVFFFFGFFFFFFLLLFLRRVFPRYRYDLLMFFFWKILLPVSLFFFFFFFFFSCF